MQTVYDNLGDVVELMPYAEDWVKTLKEQGYHLYILSNYAEHTYQPVQPQDEISALYMDVETLFFMFIKWQNGSEIYENLHNVSTQS